MPLSLSDAQLKTIMVAAGSLAPEKRGLFLERVAARLELRGRHSPISILSAPCGRRCRGCCRIRRPKWEEVKWASRPSAAAWLPVLFRFSREAPMANVGKAIVRIDRPIELDEVDGDCTPADILEVQGGGGQ
jgi:hypothetical protein